VKIGKTLELMNIMNETIPNYLGALQRPVAYHPVFAKITGSVTSAVLLSQMIYWSTRVTVKDGWFFKTYKDWEEETGMTRRNLDTARKDLQSFGILSERNERLTHRMWYKVNWDALNKLIHAEVNSPLAESYNRESTDGAFAAVRNEQPSIFTETTSDTLSETSPKTAVVPKAEPKKQRPRDEIFDAIVEASGMNLKEISSANAGMIAFARKSILEATPDCTRDEIYKRAKNYSTIFSGCTLTPTALAKHWSKCGNVHLSVLAMTPKQLSDHKKGVNPITGFSYK